MVLPTEPVAANNNLKQVAMKKILAGLPLGLSLGVGARGTVGLVDYMRRHLAPPSPPPRRTRITVPYAEEEKQADLNAVGNRAADGLLSLTGLKTPDTGPRSQPTAHIAGDNAKTTGDIPWLTAGLPLAIGGGLYGGYKLTDWILAKRRERELDNELETAKGSYEQALLSNTKTAAQLDELAEKHGSALAQGTGAYMLLASLLAGGSGVATYNWARSQQPENVLQKAYKRRQQESFARQPFPVQAVGVPQVKNTGRPQVADEEKSRPFPKAAAGAGPGAAASAFLQRRQQEQAQQQAAAAPQGSSTKKVQPAPSPRLPSLTA